VKSSVDYLAATFDLLNVRDLDVIEQALGACDHLVVGVFSDDYSERVRGRRPLVPAEERIRLVGHLRGVREVRVHQDWSASDGAEMIFVLRGDPVVITDRRLVILDPRRQSRSPLLRTALSAGDLQAVA
jgi:cytidyltransferase-like protein